MKTLILFILILFCALELNFALPRSAGESVTGVDEAETDKRSMFTEGKKRAGQLELG